MVGVNVGESVGANVGVDVGSEAGFIDVGDTTKDGAPVTDSGDNVGPLGVVSVGCDTGMMDPGKKLGVSVSTCSGDCVVGERFGDRLFGTLGVRVGSTATGCATGT
jgi:hypothetical protein